MKNFIFALLLLPLHAFAAITLGSPPSVPVISGTSVILQSVPNLACTRTDVTPTGAMVSCYFGTATTSGTNSTYTTLPQDVSFAQAILPAIVLRLNFTTGVLIVTYAGQQVIQPITLTGTQLSSAKIVLQGNGASLGYPAGTPGVQDAAEQYLLPYNATTNPSGLGIIQGTFSSAW